MFEEYPKHLYTTPGPHEGNGGVTFDFIIVQGPEEEQAARAAGWQDFADAIEPKKAPKDTGSPDDNAPPTRAELEAKAHELGIEFSPKIGDAKLAERIQAALDAHPEA